MLTPLAWSDYYGASAPLPGHQSATDLSLLRLGAGREGGPGAVPTFTEIRSARLGVQLYSDSITTPTPQAFSMVSPPACIYGFGVESAPTERLTHCGPAHIHQV